MNSLASASPKWQQKLPMWITLSRMLFVPPIIIAMSYDSLLGHWVAAILFVIASITDYFDGYFARKYNAVSTMGQFMDPIADKVLVSGILIMLVASQKIDPYMVILLLSRDTFIGGIRAIAAADQVIIAAKPTGKWKTALQMIGIPALLLGEQWRLPIDKLGYSLLWLTVFLSIISAAEYYRAYKKSCGKSAKT